MRILHLTTFLQGGAGRAIAGLACEQRRQGHDVVLVASHTAPQGYGNYPDYLDELAAAHVPVHLVDSSFTRDLGDALQVVRHAANVVDLSSLSVIHTHAAIPSLIALLLRAEVRRPLPIVQTMHGWGMRKTAAQEKADAALLDLVDRVVVPAVSSITVLRRAGAQRSQIDVVPYGVGAAGPRERDAEAVGRIEALKRGGRAVFCCVGTVGERKNQRVLVEALARLEPDERPVCVFVGDGETAALEREAEWLGVSRWVHVWGYRPDARHLVRAADWFVLPSLSEGQPLAILEAFCDGVPVLANDTPELSELVSHGDAGQLFDASTPDTAALGLRRAASMPATARHALVESARLQFAARHSFEAMVAHYMREYAAALAGPRRLMSEVGTR